MPTAGPYEGMLVCGPVAGCLIWWAVTRAQRGASTLLRRAIAPTALLLVVTGMMAYYNYRVFGDALTLPYQVNRATYASAPVFLWQPPRPEPVYRYKVMRDFYTNWELADFKYARTAAGFLHGLAKKLATVVFFFFGMVLLPPLIMLPRVLQDRRVRFLVGAGVVFGVGLSVNAWLFPHYVAPFACALYAILLQAMRHLRLWRPGNQPIGLAMVRFMPIACLILAGLRVSAGPLHLSIPRYPTMWYGTEPFGLPRARVQAELDRNIGPQLAIVRYAPGHAPFEDWVYNAADIDKSKVVWAREMEDRNSFSLLSYFRNRTVWLVEPDSRPPRISQGGGGGPIPAGTVKVELHISVKPPLP